eukprot:TRINITY_DN688_c0_g1_i6.p1 TRINITY_DN688_c0_g1~~TRINITY_DN688_c0_g1_i6.p1  ORF type:complete len:342 (+),score=92.73 TRINITY_DN688_c0_g1_i6:32-1027(+)
MSLTLHITGPYTNGGFIEATGSTRLADVKKQISSMINIPCDSFKIVHGGDVMGDMNMLVSGTALCEGDEVVIEPSRRFLAGQRLKEMGVDVTLDHLYELVLESNAIAATDEEKAEVVELMLECNPEFAKEKGAYDVTALHYASHFGYVHTMRCLIEHGADVQSTADDDLTALHFAAEAGNVDAVRMLIEYGADVHKVSTEKRTALHEAAIECCVEVIGLLLANGADPNARSRNGITPLHLAATQANGRETILALIEGGASTGLKDMDGRTPLHTAASKGHSEIVEVLLQKGSLTNSVSSTGRTPLQVAIRRRGPNDDVVRILSAYTDSPPS